MMYATIAEAISILNEMLDPSSERYKHSIGVASQVERLMSDRVMDDDLRSYVIQAALLHDIGYSEKIRRTEFHPYDGYVYLRDFTLVSPLVEKAVLHHSFSIDFAKKLNNPAILKEYGKLTTEEYETTMLVTLADVTTNNLGEPVTVMERLINIKSRYGENSNQFNHLNSMLQYIKELQARIKDEKSKSKWSEIDL